MKKSKEEKQFSIERKKQTEREKRERMQQRKQHAYMSTKTAVDDDQHQ